MASNVHAKGQGYKPKPTVRPSKGAERLSSISAIESNRHQTDRNPTTAHSPARANEYDESSGKPSIRVVNSPLIQSVLDSKKSFGGKRSSATTGNPSFVDKQQEYYKIHTEELGNNIKRAVAKEVDECTFNPAISTSREARSFDTFLREQRNHSAKKDIGLNELRAAKEEHDSKKFTKGPQISEVILHRLLLIIELKNLSG